MGRDKATLPWAAGDLLDHAIARLAAVTDDVRILCGPEVRYADRGRPVLTDVVSSAGAVAGLLTALRALPPDGLAILLAIDLPLVTPDVLHALVAHVEGFDAVVPVGGSGVDVDAVVPVGPRGAEPLCAAYRATCLDAVEGAVVAGHYKMTAFWPHVRVRQLSPPELSAAGDPAWLFANVNTADDYARARQHTGTAES
jgi:molybdopterin-guanine dinucleotide biosynthesis protein A